MNPATLKTHEVKTVAPLQSFATAHATSMRVAIVEDDPSQAELLTHWLELAGHHCHHFDRGELLIRSLDQESFDVLVLDCLRFREHPTHLWVDKALRYIDQIKPRRTFFTLRCCRGSAACPRWPGMAG